MHRNGRKWHCLLIGGAALLAVSAAPVPAGERPAPFELGRYIGWLVSCDAISGSYKEVGQALRRAVERYNLWDYSEVDVATMVKSMRLGQVGRGGWDNGEQICAHLTSNKESVEAVKKIIDLGR